MGKTKGATKKPLSQSRSQGVSGVALCAHVSNFPSISLPFMGPTAWSYEGVLPGIDFLLYYSHSHLCARDSGKTNGSKIPSSATCSQQPRHRRTNLEIKKDTSKGLAASRQKRKRTLTDLDASIAALRPNQGKAHSVDRQAILVYLQVCRQAVAAGEKGKDAAVSKHRIFRDSG